MQNFLDSTSPQPMPTDDQSGQGGGKKWAVVAVVVVLAAAAGFGYYYKDTTGSTSGAVLGVDTEYQAVFLTSGQVYFGKLSMGEGDWMQLRDIYYLQVTQQLQPDPTSQDATAQTQQKNIQLVKLGSELHGPQDVMNIDRDKILFWENMKDDSKVVEAIRKYQETKK
ncbi:MAG: hypothetical protein A3I07_01130 [Candidatus Doudnabacteria bacterium RIFCSPLOWO2_02_FULL_42_9]|uniref:Uncharacterized protein n=1 Tax=Candidatus Doudnabacteria bacterium RIFCSPHIGHO2_01_FULL_41_86 TaxID=1817821 RepID=A0A1F5N8R4_9BACT|nr:MAG: hypothetical protein A2717_00685 [Candidatus Doudnabacteria bacterium RIFCSPHIGHO2_01_FULL_41_86]OGE75359.1 MAG: hypothetical protein A3K07_01195 [Candidatus Doudnabacteria bacterium RIFCSPHIGHO2_01_43_10]OGE86534.1 MAG: hypothetical protein A3E28_04735 [Candidatus Doudnabacteria bacterium RIFCSPHIGHO2_12_FULL_42_22]OGE87457.1 MAG: hypothetical protein A3C49_01320 [Candidatus Doudnabacteria bacterium RIFCSPHIGHO2_02_FULL_42_25]OGE92753.1 MAG: hypothetical protein A2895_04490 [Candidatus